MKKTFFPSSTTISKTRVCSGLRMTDPIVELLDVEVEEHAVWG